MNYNVRTASKMSQIRLYILNLRQSERLKFLTIIEFLPLALILALATTPVAAQSANRLGTQAESKRGVSITSTYAADKIETINLANGNLSLQLPLVTIGGRGAAALSVTLSYNSKIWSGETKKEVIKTPAGETETQYHYNARFDNLPGLTKLGGGWSLNGAPSVKAQYVEIDHYSTGCSIQESGCYKYALTKAWIMLPDGSEVELRDEATQGAPYFRPSQSSGDRDRGRVWKSADGSGVTFITDAENGVVTGQLSGWVFLADGARLRMQASSGFGGICTQISDRQGNILNIDYGNINPNATTYTDQLGRQVVLQGTTITIKGFQGTPDRVIGFNLGQITSNLRSDYQTIQQPIVNGDYNPATGGHIIAQPHTHLFGDTASYLMLEYMHENSAVTDVSLLDGRQIKFRYNIYGEVAEIIYPGGGVSQIDYTAYGSNMCEGGGEVNPMLNRRVTQKRQAADGINSESTWSYFYENGSASGAFYPLTRIQAREGSASGDLRLEEKHYFLATDANYRYGCATTKGSTGSGYERWDNAKEFRVERQMSGGAIETVEKVWAQRTPVVWAADPGSSFNTYVQEHGQEQPANDPRVIQEDVILEDGKMKRVSFQYDQFNNVTSVTEYDFGSAGTPGAVLRKSERTYLTSQNGFCYTNLNGLDAGCGSGIPANLGAVIHQKHLLVSEKILDASGNQKALTEYEYDNYTPDGTHASVVINPGMINADGSRFALFYAAAEPRGNVTRVKSQIETGSYIYAYSQYDNAGNLIKTIDPKGGVSTISYSDNFGDGTNPDVGQSGAQGATFALPTLTTNVLGHRAKIQYDFILGAATGIKDANGTIARSEYDAAGRVVRVTAAYGSPQAVVSEMSYPTAASNVATVSSQLTATTWSASKIEYDGFDRAFLSSSAEDGRHASQADFTIFSKTIYDGLGRVRFQTNPYRSGISATDGWTRMSYDLAGRLTEAATFSGSVSQAPPASGTNPNWTGSVTTTYNGTTTTVTDQAGKQRRSVTNALGSLARVDEPNDAGQLDLNGVPVQPTYYSYDLLNNLISVNQGSQVRTFVYDSLSRLKSATNPESGTISYQYDANGNLTRKTDARNVQTNYSYDALNRVTQRSYTDSTPTVTYTYDNLPYAIGRLTKVSSSVSQTEYTAFDETGRVLTHRQTTDGQSFQTGYLYNLSGALLEETYPSGRRVKNTLGDDGSLAKVETLKPGEGSWQTRADSFAYTTAGAVSSIRLGNNRWESTRFNSRLQPAQIALGTSSGRTDLLKIAYDYGAANNNGNLLSQTITVPAVGSASGFTATQTYAYDSLNRLKSATENTTAQTWKQTYLYDRYGNRSFDEANTSTLPKRCSGGGGFLGGMLTVCAADRKKLNPSISAADNRLNADQDADGVNDYQYDAAGNLIGDAEGRTFAYDGENKQKEVKDAGGISIGQYFYDGDGRRVKKFIFNTQETTVFVYDASGRMAAEYSTQPSQTPQVSYLTTDNLGTPRILTDANGNVISRRDYHPFGEEVFTTQRTQGLGYTVADNVRQKFTSYERDNESNLDFAQARYHNYNHGRFTSPDPLMASARKINPQTFNRYSYVVNNPLNFIDPLGLEGCDPKKQKCGPTTGGIIIQNPCDIGTAGCSPVNLGTVTVSASDTPDEPIEVDFQGPLPQNPITLPNPTSPTQPAPQPAPQPTPGPPASGNARGGTVGFLLWYFLFGPGTQPASMPGCPQGPGTCPTPTPTPQQRITVFHYTTASPENFVNGLLPGSSTTTSDVWTSESASSLLGIPPPTLVYPVTVDPNDPNFPFIDQSPVPPNRYGPGGGTDLYFPNGTPPGSVGPPKPVPSGRDLKPR